MAQLKSTVVQGSLRVTDTTYTTDLNISSVTASKIAKIDANKNLTSGDLAESEIPNLSANKITSDTLSVDRIPGLAASKITSGTFDAARIPTLSITDKTSGILTIARGGTGIATTDPHNVLIGPSSGTAAAAPTWRVLNYQDSHGIEYIRGTWTAASGTWTGTTTDPELYDGKQIILYMPFAGSGNATLNLTLSGGGTTGAKNVYFESTTRFTTHKGQNSQLHLIYHKALTLSNGTTYEGWWYVANRDTDNDYRARQNLLADTDTSDRSLLLSNPAKGTVNNNTAYVSYRNDQFYANASTGTLFVPNASFTGTTNSTSTTTGAVKIAGGLGVSGNTWSTKYNGLTLTAASTGFTIAGGTTSKTLTVNNTYTLGAACAYSVDDATGNEALSTGTGLTTERSVYYGLVTVNGASQTRATGIYAPTGAGTTNQILVSTGGTPGWKATANGAAYATGTNGALTFGTLPIAQGGTGTNTVPTQYGIIYASSTSAYASTGAGTSGYLLQSNATAAPDWIQATSGVVPSTIVKRDDGGTIGVGNIVLQNTYTGLENTFIYMDNKNITRGTTPSADIGQWIQIRDTNATRISDISFIARTNSTMQIRLLLCNQVSDTSVANPSGLIIQKTIGSTGAENVTLDANTGRWRSLWVKAASGESQMGVESTGNSGSIFFYAQTGNGNVGVYTSKHSNLISYQYNGTVVVGDTSVGRLALNADGSAVLYSQTNHHLNLLANGNLVLYNSSNTIKWQTNTASSTRLVKNDITYLNMSEIERFKRLRPISFTYKPELRFADTSKQYGLLVEDLIYVYPELVSMPEDYDPNKFDIRKGIDQPIPGIKYQQFIPILINVVQLQQQEIETLKRKITEITTQ